MIEPNMEPKSRLYMRLLLRAVFFVGLLLFVVYALPRLLALFAPFIAGFLVALGLNPLVSWFHRKVGLPRSVSAFVLVLLVFAGVAALLSWGVYTAVNEIRSAAGNYQAIWNYVVGAFDYLSVQFAWILDMFPLFEGFDLETAVFDWISNLSMSILNSSSFDMAGIAGSVSSAIVGALVFLMGAYFITAEYRIIADLMEKYFGDRVYGYIRLMKNSTQSALWKYLRAQLLLALLAFVVMFVALLIYGQPYAFLLAFVISVFDFLPILGAGVVLVPWGIVEAIQGDVVKAVFLFALSGGFFVLRRMVEPKILGSQTGLHPIVALASIYLGFRVGGVLGAILGPLIVMIAISIYKTHIFDNTLRDIRDVGYYMMMFFRRGEAFEEDLRYEKESMDSMRDGAKVGVGDGAKVGVQVGAGDGEQDDAGDGEQDDSGDGEQIGAGDGLQVGAGDGGQVDAGDGEQDDASDGMWDRLQDGREEVSGNGGLRDAGLGNSGAASDGLMEGEGVVLVPGLHDLSKKAEGP